MKENLPTDPRARLTKMLGNAAKDTQALPDLPLNCMRIICSQDPPLDMSKRMHAKELIRAWTSYVRENNVSDENPYLLKHRITKFAEETFVKENKPVQLQAIGIANLSWNGKTYWEILAEEGVSWDVLEDENVALFGGAARLALKIHAGVDIQSELPLNDVDIIVSADADIAGKAEKYKADLPGVRTVDGDIKTALPYVLANVDCTMNQVAIHEGKLYFSPQALQDIKDGNICLVEKDDPLFGSQGTPRADGNIHLNKKGFYRALAFLLRGQGKRVIVSRENIEAEKEDIGRYWLTLLFVKILPMRNENERKKAIIHWHEIAKRIGSTKKEQPRSFLNKLMKKHPEMKAYTGAEGVYNTEAQARWIIEKLMSRAVDEIYGLRDIDLPLTYTEANLELSEDVDVKGFNYESFMQLVNSTSKS